MAKDLAPLLDHPSLMPLLLLELAVDRNYYQHTHATLRRKILVQRQSYLSSCYSSQNLHVLQASLETALKMIK